MTAEIKVCADASSYRLGTVLLQQQGELWKPVAFALHTLNDTERRYAQIEKEVLVLTVHEPAKDFLNTSLGKKSF